VDAIVAAERRNVSQREPLTRCSEVVLATHHSSAELELCTLTPDVATYTPVAMRLQTNRMELFAWLARVEDAPARGALLEYVASTDEVQLEKLTDAWVKRRNAALLDVVRTISERLQAL
jgi:hypothetical protein